MTMRIVVRERLDADEGEDVLVQWSAPHRSVFHGQIPPSRGGQELAESLARAAAHALYTDLLRAYYGHWVKG